MAATTTMANPTPINIQIQSIGRLLKPSHFSSGRMSGDEADEADNRNEDPGRAVGADTVTLAPIG